jgi:hypothetical protein
MPVMSNPPNSAIVITAADADHFDLALDMMDSVRANSTADPVKLGVLDVGLTESQRESLAAKNVAVARAQWDFGGEPPPGMPTGSLAMMSRPFLPRYFPAFDVLVYLDSDTWVQLPGAVGNLVAGALKSDLAVVPELHPTYAHLYNSQHPNRVSHRDCYHALYGESLSAPADNVLLNSGVFAARRDSRVWTDWAASLELAVAGVRDVVLDGKPLFSVWGPVIHFIEQNALNHAFYQKGFTIHPLSSLHNFICTLSRPIFDPDIRKLVEPSLPYAPIQIVHLTVAGKQATQVADRQGRLHERGLRWSSWREIVMD